jgi:UDP-N-acetylmuramyl tripeptide synthase
MLAPKLILARAVAAISRRAGRGATSLPGKVLMRLDRDAIARLAGGLRRGSVVISATNGKTTTAAMAASILQRDGTRLVHNSAGANMGGGVATALIEASGRGGRLDADLGLFEVDEFWLDRVVGQLRPRALVLGNLFRDQLDRYGELETIAERWATALGDPALAGSALVLNADDPLVADLGRERPGALYFGVDDPALALPELTHASDSKHCRRCGAPYEYERIYLGHLGVYRCPSCGARRPEPAVFATDVSLEGVHAARFTLHTPAGSEIVSLPLPGLYNVYNALAAAALATTLLVEPAQTRAGLEAVAPAFGRAERVSIDGRMLQILLVKNPAGANEVLRTLALEPGEHDLLGVLNDNTADGRDVSWIWDADFELLGGRLRRVTCSGTRAAELALRLKYAGIPEDRIVVRESLPVALDAALDGAAESPSGTLYALPTYTAMLALRDVLVRRGQVTSSWAAL